MTQPSYLRWSLENHTEHFEELSVTSTVIKKYQPQHHNLCHVRTETGYNGVVLIDHGDIFVAVLNCDIKSHIIQALDVNPKYRRRGIASRLLQIAVERFACRTLTVRKTNKAAIALYKKEGWTIQTENENMFWMTKK